MKRYLVTVKEVWSKQYYIDATDENDAVEKVHNGTWDIEGDFEYSDTLKDETQAEVWEVGSVPKALECPAPEPEVMVGPESEGPNFWRVAQIRQAVENKKA